MQIPLQWQTWLVQISPSQSPQLSSWPQAFVASPHDQLGLQPVTDVAQAQVMVVLVAVAQVNVALVFVWQGAHALQPEPSAKQVCESAALPSLQQRCAPGWHETHLPALQ